MTAPDKVEVGQLLPCPFCGGEARWLEDHGRFDDPFGLVVDHAENCFLGNRMMAEWEHIIAAWNTRATAPLEALIVELEANINLKADFIDATINQLASAEARLALLEGALGEAVERENALAELLEIALDEYETHNGRTKSLPHWSHTARTTLSRIRAMQADDGEK